MKLVDYKAKKIHEILETPGTWTQLEYFKDEKGNWCPKSEAVCGCLIGLVLLVYTHEYPVLDRLEKKLHNSVAAWNDNPARTQEEVQKLCKELDI